MSSDLRQPRWRISARSSGANSCVEASTDGVQVTVRNSNDRTGPALTVSTADWESLLAQVTAGGVDYRQLTSLRSAGPFRLGLSPDGLVELAVPHDEPARVLFTRYEWDVFVEGACQDGEFTVPWLLDSA